MREAWLLGAAFVMACGDDAPSTTLDGSTGDGSDGAVTTGMVTVSVSTRGVPQPNARVYFQRADSSLIASTMTDAAGIARAETESDSLVTVVTPWDTNIGTPVLTYAGVEPGDELVVDGPRGASRPFTLTFPDDPNTTGRMLHSSCNDEPYPTASGEMRPHDCPFPVDLLIETTDAMGGRRFLAASQQTPVDNTIAMTGTYAPFTGSMNLQISNIPSSLTEAFEYVTFENGYPYFMVERSGIVNGATSAQFAFPEATGNFKQDVILRNPDGNSHHVYSHYTIAGTTSTLDVAATQLLVEYATPPAIDRTTQILSWTPGTTGVQPTFTYAMIIAQRGEGAERRTWTREMVTPYRGGMIALPRLPVDEHDYNLAPMDNGGALEMFVSDLGYDSVRERFYEKWDPYDVLVPPLGTTARHIEFIPR